MKIPLKAIKYWFSDNKPCEILSEICTCTQAITVKLETLTSGNFDKFSELESNRQTLTFQSKATKQNKHTI